MTLSRRTLLSSTGSLLAIGAAAAGAANTHSEAAVRDAGPLRELLGTAQKESLTLSRSGAGFSGAGWDRLVAEARAARHFLLGEEHGIAENAMLAKALFAAVQPHGYDRIALETSQPMARMLTQSLGRGGIEALRRQMRDPLASAVFFGLEEEAQWIADAYARAKNKAGLFIGLDFELTGLFALIDRLGDVERPVSANGAWLALRDAARQSQARYLQTRDPSQIPSFALPPKLAADLMSAWTQPNPEVKALLEVIHETLVINRLMQNGRMYESNLQRTALMRRQLAHAWKAAPRSSRMLLKLGAGHLQRGRSPTGVFDVGNMVHEMAALDGGRAFSLLVLPGKGSEIALFDPSAWVYRPGPTSADTFAPGLSDFVNLADPGLFTLFDLRPLRPAVQSLEGKGVTASLASCLHGFDMLLVMSGSTPSQNIA